MNINLYVALLHHPVYKKDRKTVITTSITPMDVHDIARTCMTYGVKRYYVVNPMKTMQTLALRMREFWSSEYGRAYNHTRTRAFEIAQIVDHIEDCVGDIERIEGKRPLLAATSAQRWANTANMAELRERAAREERPVLLLLGTGYGLIREFIERCDLTLEPIEGRTGYNHLSVRGAAAILLDRLFR